MIGDPDAVLPQPPARGEAVQVGKHHVQHQRVVLGGPDHPQRVGAGDRHVRDSPVGPQPAPDRGGHAHIVLHHQHVHAPIIPGRMRGG